MNNLILIHHKNVPENINVHFADSNIIEFTYCNSKFKNIDEYISKVIIENLKNKEFKIIYVKDNLSSNYLELYGLRVVYHIRLSQELAEKRFVPIVLLSDLDACILNKLEPMGSIVFTKNIYLEQNNLKTIKKYNEKIEKNNFPPFNITNYKKNFLDLISIESPENSTNHSIANEWAIYKWAKELNINSTNSIETIIQKLIHSLYFKYLKSIQNIEETIEIKSPKFKKVGSKYFKPLISKNTKILYIDDEWDKGWKEVLEQYFSQPLEKPLETIKYNFTNKTYEDAEQFIIEYINNYHPDLIILDMRLVVIDHKKETNPEDISGIKLLNKIKCTSLDTKLNPGIQVVMLSATTRSDILEQAYKENKIVGYIQKDHMENRFFSTKENIEKLSELLINAEKNFYMKNIWSTQKEILNFNIIKRSSDEYMISIKLQVESIFNLLNSNLEKKINLVILSFYNIIEFLIKYYGGTHGSGFSQIKDICNDKLGIHTLDTSLSEIICTRNYKAHGEDETEIQKYCQKNTIKDPNNTYIVKWFEAIKEILKEINKKESK